ncbi:dihydrolipoamide acetyltransferase family protein [Microbacterium sp. nov. GSS16]|uniref:dihydrolipoamide acetyltransferase family protein n=1 Tax=Microbacterium sp. nov. GSS16 TaxID=3019890 RepID=UPI002305E4E3|nr:dihydrolipoamide acetyltransferase family protein [Microbacterium sp. nov. GSS16]WCD92711.1 dihydrolipoamide acetyltransferase family protein [Microbacterium sp. nov. GSS16]
MTTATARVFRLPDLGEGLTEAGLVQWLVQVGDTITTDQAIAEVETAKSIVELPSPFAGVVTALHGEAGDVIAVGAPVLEVADGISDEAVAGAQPDGAQSDAEKDAYRTEERAGSGNVLIGYGTTERVSSGRRRPRASGSSLAPPPLPPRARHLTEGTATSREEPAHAATSHAVEKAAPRTVAVRSPIVRRLARDLGVDVGRIDPTGADGAVTRADVLRAAALLDGEQSVEHREHRGPEARRQASGSHGQASGTRARRPDGATDGAGATDGGGVAGVDGLTVASRERLSPMRKAISETLTRSRAEIPEATVWVDVDATELFQARSQMAAEGERAPSLTALVARFTLMALADFPLLASRLSDDASEIVTFDGVNLGVAADTERGLMVPVIARAHDLTVDELDAQLRELAATARAGRMPADRLRGSTFTLNNYGSLGVDGSAAIINHPEVAIMGVGRMIERPWVVDGQIVARRIAQLSLVFDHRVCDGGYAAGFLRRVVELIEHPLRAFGRL